MGRRGGLQAAALVVTIGAGALLAAPQPAHASATRFSINGKRMQLSGEHLTVADALDAAGLQLRVGFMRSVATGEPVPHQVRQPRVYLHERPVDLKTRVGNGDAIRVVNGADFVEPTVVKTEQLTGAGLPPVEAQLWTEGKAGVVERRVGRYSGQSAGETVVAQPQPAAPVADKVVMLTFDDGPDPRWTPQVLDILKAKKVAGLFCLVGVQMRAYPELVKRIFAEGHQLCDHSDHHDMRMPFKSNEYITAEIEVPYRLIVELTGVAPKYYRGPGGTSSPFIIGEAHRLGMRVLNWSVDPGDYRKPGAAMIQNRIAVNVRGGGVALLHDGGGDRSQTVAQLPGLIDRLRAEGYTIVLP